MISILYTAIIERPDGSTYEQPFLDVFELIELCDFLGDSYIIVDIY